MVKAAFYSPTGTKRPQPLTLDAAVFDQAVNHQVLELAHRSYLAAGRVGAPAVKNRGDVSGGGKKPWKQKGTGRARVGSSRVPQWRGGGVVFGPTGQENHRLNLSAATKRAAVRQALSAQAQAGQIVVLETFACPDGKIKPTVALLQKLGASGRVLLVVSQKDALVDRATRNLADLKVVQANYLNVFDLLAADLIIISQSSLDLLKSWLVPVARTETPKSPPSTPKSPRRTGSSQLVARRSTKESA